MQVIVSESGTGRYQQEILVGTHRLIADEPLDAGGDDAGPAPFDLLLASLGTCTAMTLRMYAERKELVVRKIKVALTLHRERRENESHDWIAREIEIDGDLSDAQRQRLQEIANRCPLHRALQHPWRIDTTLQASPT